MNELLNKVKSLNGCRKEFIIAYIWGTIDRSKYSLTDIKQAVEQAC
jgi:hypothetical protein